MAVSKPLRNLYLSSSSLAKFICLQGNNRLLMKMISTLIVNLELYVCQ